MNTIVYNILLTGDKFMPKLHLRQPKFAESACEPFAKHSARFKNSEKQVI